jgi:hypothetical protein
MSPTLTCLAMALVGVDLGYRPCTNGGTDFVIHVNPATLLALQPGEAIPIAVPRDAREMRLGAFTLTPENGKLAGEVSLASQLPPAAMPNVSANPMVQATATSASVPPREPADDSRYGPPAQPKSTAADGGPLLMSKNSGVPASSADSKMVPLSQVPDGGNSPPTEKAWLGMCLLVIGLTASNAYVGWLFWDARQRYRDLLARTFSFSQQPAEA